MGVGGLMGSRGQNFAYPDLPIHYATFRRLYDVLRGASPLLSDF